MFNDSLLRGIDFVVVQADDYVGFHSTNIPHPIKGLKKGESCLDCARMLKEEYSDRITIAADISKDVYTYGIMFRKPDHKDKIYINKIRYMMAQERAAEKEKQNNLAKVIANAKEQTR